MVPERQSETVFPDRKEQIVRNRDLRIRLLGERSSLLHRIGYDGRDRRLVIGKPIDEGSIGAVLQEPSHKIREQVPVAADGGIDAAWLTEALGANHLPIKRLPHAVKALELARTVARNRDNSCDGMGVVCRKLRIEAIGLTEKQARGG